MSIIYNGTTITDPRYGTTILDQVKYNDTIVYTRIVAITKPTISNSSKTYNGSGQSPTISGYDSTSMSQSGTTSATNVGNYSITYTCKSGYQFSDGTTTTVTLNWSIGKYKVTIPTLSNTSQAFVEGATRTVTVNNRNSTYVNQSGTTSTSAQGSYTVTWSLKNTSNTQWSDKTTGNKTATWKINWVNGTSHYNNDVFNKGWIKSGVHIVLNSLSKDYLYPNESFTITTETFNSSTKRSGSVRTVTYTKTGETTQTISKANEWARDSSGRLDTSKAAGLGTSATKSGGTTRNDSITIYNKITDKTKLNYKVVIDSLTRTTDTGNGIIIPTHSDSQNVVASAGTYDLDTGWNYLHEDTTYYKYTGDEQSYTNRSGSISVKSGNSTYSYHYQLIISRIYLA